MIKRLLIRLGWSVLVLIGTAGVSFLIARAVPGDPARVKSFAQTPSTPKRGGILRIGKEDDPSGFDLPTVTSSEDNAYGAIICQGLLDWDGERFIPFAADRWEVSEDARTFTFHLNPRVKFSNGRLVTPADYIYSIERVLHPKTASWMQSLLLSIEGAPEFRHARALDLESPRSSGGWFPIYEHKPGEIAGLTAPTPQTLMVRLAKPDLSFLYTIAQIFRPVPKEQVDRYGNEFARHAIGIGPYRIKAWRHGIRLELDRNPYYFAPEKYALDGIEVLIGGDGMLREMMFERGELDVADWSGTAVGRPDYLRVSRDSRLRKCLQDAAQASVSYLSLNTEVPPLDNLKVRQAISHGIDKEALLKYYFDQELPAKGVLSPVVAGYNPKLRGYAFDPGRARQLLAEAGFTNDIGPIELWAYPQSFVRAQLIQNQLAKIGIDIQIKSVTFAALNAAISRRKQVPMCLIGWNNAPDPYFFLPQLFHGRLIAEKDSTNMSFYNNPDLNKLLDEAEVCPNSNHRLELYQQAEAIIVADAPAVFLSHTKFSIMCQPWVKGINMKSQSLETAWLDR